MYLVINKWVIAVNVSKYSGQYLPKHWNFDIGVLGYIGIVLPKEHSPEVWSVPPVTPYIYICHSSRQLRVKRLLFSGCTSGSMRGFGCESRAVRWVAVRSRKTVCTLGMCSSEWRQLETYHGAVVIDLRSLAWYRWMTAMLDLVAHPQTCIWCRSKRTHDVPSPRALS